MSLLLNSTEGLPVKPLLGETLSGTIEDEVFIYLEQVSIVPSVAQVLVTSAFNKFRIWGDIRVD